MKKRIIIVILVLICSVVIGMAICPDLGHWQERVAYGVMWILLAWALVDWMALYSKRGGPIAIGDLKMGVWYDIYQKLDYIGEANLGFRSLLLVSRPGCDPVLVKIKNTIPPGADMVRLYLISTDDKTIEAAIGRQNDTSFVYNFTL